MKKYLPVVFLVLFGACQNTFSSGRYPSDMPPRSEFSFLASDNKCGVKTNLGAYEVNARDMWLILYLEKSRYPFLIVHSVKSQNGLFYKKREFWVSGNSDGKYQRFNNFESFAARYGDNDDHCNIIN